MNVPNQIHYDIKNVMFTPMNLLLMKYYNTKYRSYYIILVYGVCDYCIKYICTYCSFLEIYWLLILLLPYCYILYKQGMIIMKDISIEEINDDSDKIDNVIINE